MPLAFIKEKLKKLLLTSSHQTDWLSDKIQHVADEIWLLMTMWRSMGTFFGTHVARFFPFSTKDDINLLQYQSQMIQALLFKPGMRTIKPHKTQYILWFLFYSVLSKNNINFIFFLYLESNIFCLSALGILKFRF